MTLPLAIAFLALVIALTAVWAASEVSKKTLSPYYSWCPSDLSKASGVSRVDGGFLRLIL